MNPPTLYTPTKHAHLLPSIVSCHISCITSPPFTISTFLPPLDRSLMTEYWTRACASTANSDILSGSRWIILQLTEDEKEVAGLVMLSAAFSQAVPERGTVQKLLVNPEYRRQGVAKALMGKLEDVAREEGRLFLNLDTEAGSPAEEIYKKWGYVVYGRIPRVEVSPRDGKLKDGVYMYKDMRELDD